MLAVGGFRSGGYDFRCPLAFTVGAGDGAEQIESWYGRTKRVVLHSVR